jgi:hypothetical protein
LISRLKNEFSLISTSCGVHLIFSLLGTLKFNHSVNNFKTKNEHIPVVPVHVWDSLGYDHIVWVMVHPEPIPGVSGARSESSIQCWCSGNLTGTTLTENEEGECS